jgi:trans-2-enoyl-CoA reductase
VKKNMEPMDLISAFAAITVPIVATVLFSGRQTRRILGKLERCLVQIDRTQRDMRRLQQKMYKEHRCLLRKIDVGLRANAHIHGWERRDGLTPEQIRRLPKLKVYDEELGVCYFKHD